LLTEFQRTGDVLSMANSRHNLRGGVISMNPRHSFFAITALLMCVLLAIPADVLAQAADAQHAGKITTLLPIVNVIRGAQQTPASVSESINWGDVINTGHLARARVALDDGSILSVGSDSNLAVVKHDPDAQQTDLDLNYGRVRARAAALVKPDAHFRVRTPVGVAGVVGTEMVVIFDSNAGTMQVVCLEGTCQVCDLAGNCVILKAGQESTVRSDQAPTAPSPATPMNITDAINSTNPAGGAGAAGGIGAGAATAIGVGAAVAVTAAIVVVRSVSKTPTCPSSAAEAAHVVPAASCAARSTAVPGKAPGQRP
jgi:hypothetical protein